MNKKEMQAFEDHVKETEKFNVIGIGFKPSDLRGIGLEYLVVNGQIAAKFFDGVMVVAIVGGNTDKTI